MTGFSAFSQAETQPLPEDSVLKSATFATDFQPPKSDIDNEREAGLVVALPGGWGLMYGQKITPNRYIWGKTFYVPEHSLFMDPYQDGATDVADIHELSRMQLTAGVDEIFHPTHNPSWGLILGASVGVNRSEYRSTYYPATCNGHSCLFYPNTGITKQEVDSYAFLATQAGIGILDTQILSLKGNLKFIGTFNVARTGHFAFTSPNGNEHEVRPIDGQKNALFTIESTVIF